MSSVPDLRRSVSLPLLVLYGLGTIIGAGIYVLIGEVVARAGTYAPFSFLLAAAIASLTALAYAELSSRYPRSAGEAAYVQEGFSIRWLSMAVGWGVVAIGVVSSATIIRGFVGYLTWFVYLPHSMVITLLVVVLTAIAAWGITQSVWVAATATLMEIAGLLLVVGVNVDVLSSAPGTMTRQFMIMDWDIWAGVVLGAFLAFYAFIGFEDMVNLAEEVKDAQQTLPRAIVLTLIISVALYILIALVSVLVLPIAQISASSAPLSDLVEPSSAMAARVVAAISLVAIINGALIQIIKVSRVLYGMGSQGLAPAALFNVNPVTRTPVRATLLVAALVLALSLGMPVVRLAEITSFITLVVFAVIHVTLLRVKLDRPIQPGTVSYPLWIPVAGFVTTLSVLLYQIQHTLF